MKKSNLAKSEIPRSEFINSPHADLLDNIYRFQTPIYDLTRKFFLLGRDVLLERAQPAAGAKVLELGCGTGRNLVKLASTRPDIDCFGVDASQEMLEKARKSVSSLRRLEALDNIKVGYGLAESFSSKELFDVSAGEFDIVFFSYSLSMMPTWSEALDHAVHLLKPGGKLYVVDFWDQAELPGFFRKGLGKWLDLFHVKYDPRFLEKFSELEDTNKLELEIESLHKRYAFLLTAKKL